MEGCDVVENRRKSKSNEMRDDDDHDDYDERRQFTKSSFRTMMMEQRAHQVEADKKEAVEIAYGGLEPLNTTRAIATLR
jgi:hypothetical protein